MLSQRSRHCRLLGRFERLEDRRVLAALPVISEFMAVNKARLPDVDQEFQDWIEVANLGDEPMSLSGWALTDDVADLSKWSFPDVSLAAGQYLIVFASGKDRSDASGQLHTNFRLDADGEYLALTQADAEVFAYGPNYPAQVADVSFGIYGSGEQQGYFAVPTPGAPNRLPPETVPPQALVINEIMYHPPSESDAEEYVELLNYGTQAVNLTGWRVSGGIDMQLPNVTVAAGATLVLAADVNMFQAAYGANVTPVGPWTGRLSNQSDTITLRDNQDRVVDRVTYADEGDWAQRGRGPEDRGTRGWVWLDDHDGGGKSLELTNPRLPNELGQNWQASLVTGGTPGQVNSRAAENIAPLVIDLEQSPVIPRATDSVTISARVLDELDGSVAVTLNWRTNSISAFNTVEMRDLGLNGDALAGDGIFSATIPPLADRVIVEYYVAATDAAGQTRTLPAATAGAGQETNALYQVINEFDPMHLWQDGDVPTYYQIMTDVERQTFGAINRLSNAQMNATFISVDGQGIQMRHNAGIRIRGSGSRGAAVPNNRINIPSDRPWDGVTALNLNVDTIRNQIAGSLLFRLAGVPVEEAVNARMYSNGSDLRQGQLYAHLEPLNGDFAANNFPLDPNGNLYKGRRPDESPSGGLGAGLVYYEGNPVAYSSYTKLTNESEADWSDVIELTRVLNNAPDETYLEELAKVVNVDQWLRYFAMHVMVSNTEGGLVNGDRLGDDYAMYRGVADPRFIMITHDLDSILSQVSRPLFTATNVPALRRMLFHPELKTRYYEQLLDIAENVFLADDTAPQLSAALQQVASQSQIDAILRFLQRRAEFVKNAVPIDLAITASRSPVDGRIETSETAIGMHGYADYRANSVRVNGAVVPLNPLDNSWQLGSFDADLVPLRSDWQYRDDGTVPAANWPTISYVPDANWKVGAAELGYGDGNEATVIEFGGDPANKHITSYFRIEFDVPDASRYETLLARLTVDDGAIVYLNGKEIFRQNLPGGQLNELTLATAEITGGAESSGTNYGLNPADLVNGKNVLAVEVHQASVDSDDLSFQMRLYGRFNPPNTGAPVNPGLNKVVVQAMSGLKGTGDVLATQTIEVWRKTNKVQMISGDLPSESTTWSATDGPYQLSGVVRVPVDGRLIIRPGASIYFEAGAELVIEGTLEARGSELARIRFTSVPGVNDVPDLPGLPIGPPRWKGIHFKNSRQDDNAITYADIEYAQDASGSVGVLDSTAEINHVSFKGTHLRMVFATNASLVVRNCDFPDMFAADEDPAALGLDNVSEHIKATGRTPLGGQFVIQGNRFGRNKGHNDVIDVDSNRASQGPIVQILDNVFTGSGDELLDLGGDVYVAGNLFRGVAKDDSTSDRGYANAISTGDAGANTTIVVTRNVFVDVDHAINLKAAAAAIFEYNTVVGIHPDFNDRFGNPSVASAINLYVDEPGATRGAGAYAGQNVFWDVPRVFGNADLPIGQQSALQFENNLLPADLAATVPGQRTGTLLDLGRGNTVEDPRFMNPGASDFLAAPGSAARAPALPMPWGADASPRLWIAGEPATRTALRQATLMVGGPGMFAYRYRVNSGLWSDPIAIGNGFDTNGTVRTAKIELNDLPDGTYFVEVQGRDFAGVWQVAPTRSTAWTVATGYSQLLINEVLTDNQTTFREGSQHPDLIELYNAGETPIDLHGLQLSDNQNQPGKFVFPDHTVLPAYTYLVLRADGLTEPGNHLGFSLDSDGEGLYLFSPAGVLLDSVEFGLQVPDFSIGRIGPKGEWRLTRPTFGAANQPARLGDPAKLSINEWLAAGVGEADFVELYNSDALPVEIGGFYLSDAGGVTPQRHQIAPLSFIAARGFATFLADGKSSRAANHLNFQLNWRQESLRLSDHALAEIDTIVYPPQVPEMSQGRLVDGGSLLVRFAQPTPGWINGGGGAGDLSGDGVIDVNDIDLLCAAVRAEDNRNSRADLTRDTRVDQADVQHLVEVILGTSFGDVNLDGQFDSRDLVLVFQAGQYEDGLDGNSTWTTGDWNCDGEFGTSDLVVAFQVGTYVAASRPLPRSRSATI